MKILGSRVLVKPDEAVKSFGSIVLPEAMWDKVNRGTVVNSGLESTISVGAQVIYLTDDVEPYTNQGEDLLFVTNEKIYAVI